MMLEKLGFMLDQQTKGRTKKSRQYTNKEKGEAIEAIIGSGIPIAVYSYISNIPKTTLRSWVANYKSPQLNKSNHLKNRDGYMILTLYSKV